MFAERHIIRAKMAIRRQVDFVLLNVRVGAENQIGK